VLAACLLVGAELNALAGVLQHYRWHTFLDPVVTVKVTQQVFGNIAQPNHYANYIALGLCSLGLLHTRFGWRAGLTALLATPMLFVLVLSGSRSAWLYLSFILLLAWLWQRWEIEVAHREMTGLLVSLEVF
jgi:O-antigen ligase